MGVLQRVDREGRKEECSVIVYGKSLSFGIRQGEHLNLGSQLLVL